MSLGDPSWELADPTPNVCELFVQFDKTFFWCTLSNRAVVRWSKRMYSCAGICSYEGRGGLCDIALSEPLLKLRPRKDLVETLLHEMIHAYLFIAGGDRDRDGHGPMFQTHMYRINKAAGLNITIYHDFHDEVRLYQTHWWRCDGPCQYRKPFFGLVKRTANRAPGPKEWWWEDHKRKCGGTFIKIREPESTKTKKTAAPKKPMGDITKYFNNNNTCDSKSPVTKVLTIADINNKNPGTKLKTNNTNTLVVTKSITNPNSCPCNDSPGKPVDKNKNIVLWTGKGYTIADNRNTFNSNDVTETVRNIWANKQINSTPTKSKVEVSNKVKNTNKRTSLSSFDQSPPLKVTKIDDYFKKPTVNTATSVLKGIYGNDFMLYQNQQSGSKMIALQNQANDTVNCPICETKISSSEINKHLDECLNKDEIKKICDENNIDNKRNVTESTNPIKSDTEVKIDSNNIDTNGLITNKINTYSKINYPLPSTSRENNIQSDLEVVDLTNIEQIEQKCPCCAEIVKISMEQHLDECSSFMNDSATQAATVKTEIQSSFDDDDFPDEFDESLTFNDTGTKYPCPSCLNMVEQDDMNVHLDECLT